MVNEEKKRSLFIYFFIDLEGLAPLPTYP